jgi:hypothetical protein
MKLLAAVAAVALGAPAYAAEGSSTPDLDHEALERFWSYDRSPPVYPTRKYSSSMGTLL